MCSLFLLTHLCPLRSERPAAGSWSSGGADPHHTSGLCGHTEPPGTGAALLCHAHSIQYRWAKHTSSRGCKIKKMKRCVLLTTMTCRDISKGIQWIRCDLYPLSSQSTSWPAQTSLLYTLWRHLVACCQPACPHGSSRLFLSKRSNNSNNSSSSSSNNSNNNSLILHHLATWCKSFLPSSHQRCVFFTLPQASERMLMVGAGMFRVKLSVNWWPL